MPAPEPPPFSAAVWAREKTPAPGPTAFRFPPRFLGGRGPVGAGEDAMVGGEETRGNGEAATAAADLASTVRVLVGREMSGFSASCRDRGGSLRVTRSVPWERELRRDSPADNGSASIICDREIGNVDLYVVRIVCPFTLGRIKINLRRPLALSRPTACCHSERRSKPSQRMDLHPSARHVTLSLSLSRPPLAVAKKELPCLTTKLGLGQNLVSLRIPVN